jgi:stress-induced morphogen
MPMTASEIEKRIKAALPDAQIDLRDLAGDDNHWAATIVSFAERANQSTGVRAAFIVTSR